MHRDTVVRRICVDSGSVCFKGSVQKELANLTAEPAKSELVIKNASGVVQSLIDEDGNLKMRGNTGRIDLTR